MTSNLYPSARILIVDANAEQRKTKLNVLLGAGFQAIEAATGAEALIKSRANRPNLILLDFSITDVAYLDLCQELKNDPKIQTTLIVQTLPAKSTFQDNDLIDHYLPEPIAPNELVATVKVLLRLEKAECDLHTLERWNEDFLLSLAHDLRNPLAPIINSIELLRKLDPVVPAMQEKARNTIKFQAKTISSLIDDLLEASRLSREKILLERDMITPEPEKMHTSDTAANASNSEQRETNKSPESQTSLNNIATPISADSRLPKRVLVVDDNVDVADTLAQWLRLAGHNVHIAYTGAEAIESAPDFHPEIVLLDIGLPDSSGFDIAKKLRALPNMKRFLLVAVTGYGQASLKKSVLEAGFDEHFAKPMSFDKLSSIGLHV